MTNVNLEIIRIRNLLTTITQPKRININQEQNQTKNTTLRYSPQNLNKTTILKALKNMKIFINALILMKFDM